VLCLLTFFNHPPQNEFLSILGEVLLCLKDSNVKSQEAAYKVLLAMAEHSNKPDFLKAVTAGLGAETPHMRSAVVMALSRLVYTYAWNDPDFQALLPSLFKTVFVLVNEDSREVIKSVIGFVRVCVVAIPPEELLTFLPELVGGLLTHQKKKDRFRMKIKIILKKLVKLFGYDTLMPLVPQTETRLLTHMRKLEERQKRRKVAEKETRDRSADGFHEMLDSDEEDSDDGRTFLSGTTGLTRHTTASRKSGSRKSVKKSTEKGGGGGVRLSDNMDGDVVDMLGSKFQKRVHFAEDDDDEPDSDQSDLEFDLDGKLVIKDTDDNEAGSKVSQPSTAIKRRRLNSGESRSVDQRARTKSGLGAAYKSKKAGGDVKKKGQKYEPYAFVPLDGRSYSKKNRRVAVEQMSTVVRGKDKRKKN